MNTLLFRLAFLFPQVYIKAGVNLEQLRLILKMKLILDDRRPLSFSGRAQKEAKGSSWMTFFLLSLMGCVLLVFLLLVNKPFLSYTIYFAAFMAMLCLSLIADFSVILLDTRDNTIILPKPVEDITLTVARIVHIGISIAKQVIGLALPGLVYTAIKGGVVSALFFLVQVSSATVLSVLLVNLFYLLSMRLFSPGKFKDIVAYLQIFFSVLIFVLYYTMPHLLESALIRQLDFNKAYWLWITPAAWIAALQELASYRIHILSVCLSALALLAPFLAFRLIIQKLAVGFNKVLIALHSGREEVGLIPLMQKKRWSTYLASIFTFSPLERAGFKFVWQITARTRDFKTKVYPSMAYMPVYFIFFFFFRNQDKNVDWATRWQKMVHDHLYVMVFYFSLFTLLTVFQFITQSERYKAAWIYFVAPIQQTGLLMLGILKAVFVKFYMPFALLFAGIGLIFIGPSILNDVLLAIAMAGITAVLICLFTVKGYPFSQPLKKTEGRFLLNFLLIGLIGISGFGHYALAAYEGLVWGLALFCWVILFVLLHFFKKESWENAVFND